MIVLLTPEWLVCRRLRIGRIAAEGRMLRRLSRRTNPSDKDSESKSDFKDEEYWEN